MGACGGVGMVGRGNGDQRRGKLALFSNNQNWPGERHSLIFTTRPSQTFCEVARGSGVSLTSRDFDAGIPGGARPRNQALVRERMRQQGLRAGRERAVRRE